MGRHTRTHRNRMPTLTLTTTHVLLLAVLTLAAMTGGAVATVTHRLGECDADPQFPGEWRLNLCDHSTHVFVLRVRPFAPPQHTSAGSFF